MTQTKAQLIDGKSAEIEFAGGSASAPAISFTGDANTGIYSPGADQVAISTNSVGRLFIDSSGRIGVGAASPGYPLQVDTTGTGTAAGDNTSIYIQSQASGRDCNIRWGDSVNASARIGYLSNNLYFYVNGGERARITSDGKLGLGTSSPSTKLHVTDESTTTEVARFYSNASKTVPVCSIWQDGAGASGPALKLRNDGSGNALEVHDGSDGNVQFVIDSSNRVGVGTTAPATSLHLLGANTAARGQLSVAGNAADPRITLYRDNAFIGGFQADTTNGVAIAAETGYSITFNPGGGSEKGRFDSSGRLLVGTSTVYSSSDTLIVHDVDAGARIGLQRQDSGQVTPGEELGAITFYSNDGDLNPSARISAEADLDHAVGDKPGRLVFSVTSDGSASPTERVRLDNAGNFFVYSSGSDTVVGGNAAGSGTSQSVFTGVHSRTSTTGGGTVCYRIYNNGTTFSVSDARQKKNIETARNGYLEDLQQLRVVKYNWLDQDDSESKELGLIAQEVAEVFPGLVQSADPSDPESTLGIKSSVFSYMLIKALQEAAEKIQSLEARLSALESA